MGTQSAWHHRGDRINYTGPEYLRMSRKQESSAIIAEYDYEEFFVNDMLYFQVNKGMYGLPQAGLLAQYRLIASSPTLPSMDTHNQMSCPVFFVMPPLASRSS